MANHVPLEDGENTITATATDMQGNTETYSITVYSDSTADYIRITADPEFGVAPFETTLELETTFPFTADPVLTYAGPDVVEFPNQGKYNVIITTPGIYYFNIEVTDNQSSVFTDTVAIEVSDLAQIDARLTGKWSEMRKALTESDIETAGDFFEETSRDAYIDHFTALSHLLPQIAQDMSDIQCVKAGDSWAEYDIRITEDGVEYSYYVLFVKDENGLWKIRAF
jgi:hypothetical protein